MATHWTKDKLRSSKNTRNYNYISKSRSPRSVGDVVTLDELLLFETRQGQDILLFSKRSRPAQGLTHFPIQCVSRFSHGRDADNSIYCRHWEWVEVYLCSLCMPSWNLPGLSEWWLLFENMWSRKQKIITTGLSVASVNFFNPGFCKRSCLY